MHRIEFKATKKAIAEKENKLNLIWMDKTIWKRETKQTTKQVSSVLQEQFSSDSDLKQEIIWYLKKTHCLGLLEQGIESQPCRGAWRQMLRWRLLLWDADWVCTEQETLQQCLRYSCEPLGCLRSVQNAYQTTTTLQHSELPQGP